MELSTDQFDYHLPPELIAEWPAETRDGARMLVLHKDSGEIEHRMFRDFPEYLREGDLAVLNDAKVFPARLIDDTGKIEIFLLESLTQQRWIAMVRPGPKMRAGDHAIIKGVRAQVREITEDGNRIVEFDRPPDLEALGQIPLPPYIRRKPTDEDRQRYQTVFARTHGAVAAPTAGLHFTPELLAHIPHAFVTLLVGPGTFQPVRASHLSEHRMHRERYRIEQQAVTPILAAKRVVAIGTTVVRALEGCIRQHGALGPAEGSIDLFIYPPFTFGITGALLTNFHLPRSTLLMLVSAFGGMEHVRRAYAQAVERGYRFYSYGDCMLLV